MSTSEAPTAQRGSIANVIDIVIAPTAAFERLRAVPAWGWAFLVASLLGIAGTLMVTPALLHAADTTLPAQFAAAAQTAKLPPEQQQSMIAAQMKGTRIFFQLAWLVIPIVVLIAGLIQALIMLFANTIGHGDGSFKKFFALAVTVTVVGVGLKALVDGLIVTVRGASSFESLTALQNVTPSLALLVPGNHGALAGFLGAFNVFSLWSTALTALGMMVVARIPRTPAWATAVLMLLVGAAWAAVGASRNG